MNEVQEKLLEMSKLFIGICEQLNLRYFAIGGTALGAVRHNGFIPWDDDMDFGMPRKDYEIFIKECQKYLPSSFFLQTNDTDKEYFYPFCKIRNSETTFVEADLEEFNINHGLWIDIFPMDGLPTSYKKRKQLQFLDSKFYRKRYLNSKYNTRNFHTKCTNFLLKILLPSKKCAYRLSKKLSTKYDYEKCEVFWYNWVSRILRERKKIWFDDYTLFKFEDITIRVPICWDEYLKCEYGNWREFPPENKRNSGHLIAFIDIKKSYKSYIKDKFAK